MAWQGAEFVGLHVRQSNRAAVRLYERFEYCVDEILPSYYQDGEDAFFMKKELTKQSSGTMSSTTNNGLFHSLRRLSSRPWEQGPEDWRLPRTVGQLVNVDVPTTRNELYYEAARPDRSDELLTGSM
jgi:hypothetical protein